MHRAGAFRVNRQISLCLTARGCLGSKRSFELDVFKRPEFLLELHRLLTSPNPIDAVEATRIEAQFLAESGLVKPVRRSRSDWLYLCSVGAGSNSPGTLQSGRRMPRSIRADMVGDIESLERILSPPITWIQDPGTGIHYPYQVTPDPGIPTETHSAFNDDAVEAAKSDVRRLGLAVLKQVVPRVSLVGFKNYFKSLHEKGAFLPDPSTPGRTCLHNEPITRMCHKGFGNLVGRIVGESVKPSYSFLAWYGNGTSLPVHTDREQCAWNISLVYDDGGNPWPIYIRTANLDHCVALSAGDAVLFRGAEMPHWRNRLVESTHHIICFFHFVSRDFNGSLD